MKKLSELNLIVTLLICMTLPRNVLAHNYSGELGASATAVDKFIVNCTGTGSELFASILDSTGTVDKVLQTVEIKKKTVQKTTDSDDGGNATASPGITNTDGKGVYTISVSKDGAATQKYTLTYHCQNDKHIHTVTPALIVKQNQ